MNKYDILLNILDELMQEAPASYVRYYPDPHLPEKLDQARARTFIHLFLKVKYGILTFEEREAYITDEVNDGGVDAYYIDHDSKSVIFIQSKFRTTQKNFEHKEITLDEILHMDIDRMVEGMDDTEDGIAYNSKIRAMIRTISTIDDIGRYHYQVVILANLNTAHYRDSQIRRLTGGFSAQIFDYERCYNELIFPIVTGCYYNANEITIKLSLTDKENEGGRIGYNVSTNYGNCKIMVTFIPLLEVAKVVSKYKNSVLKYNPRCFLSLNNNIINPKIRNTIEDRQTNEIALYNNGITILSDGTFFNSQVALKDTAKLSIKNPQIVNGGQTAYTLSSIYEQNEDYMEIFEGKEILTKIITFLGEYKESDKLQLIEELSRASNEQTPVKEVDRRSNDKVQIDYQRKIYEEFGYFYNRKMGEFYDGLNHRYISREHIIDRTIFMRVASSVQGDVSKARRNSEDVLFKQEYFDEIFQDSNIYRHYMYGYFCHVYLTELEKKYARSVHNKYGKANYGYALRYGKYAVTYVVSQFYTEALEPNRYDENVRLYTDMILSQWNQFEKSMVKKSSNRDYFYEGVDESGTKELYYNYDGYYKGRTLNHDLIKYQFSVVSPLDE